MSRCIFHMDLDAFFVAVERILDPSLVNKPVIVSPGSSRSVVSAASYEARKFGVHSAQPIAQARRLCPQAVICPGNFSAYQKYSNLFFRIIEAYSPDIEPASLDEAYLDYTACEKLFGPPLAAATEIQARVKNEIGLDVSLGISASKVVSKIASDLAKPAGILYVLAGHEAAMLAPLPIRRLMGVGPKTEPRLQALGIRTIGDLARLPRALLVKALGEGSLWLAQAAQGMDDSAVEAREEAKSISHEETFSVDTTDPALLRHTLFRLSCEVGYRLRENGLKAGSVMVKVRYADFSLHTRSAGLPQATDIDRVIFESAQSLLAKACDRRVRIRLVGVAAQKLEDAKAQGQLLALAEEARLDKLHSTADRIRRRYGNNKMRWASLMHTETE